MSNGSKQKEYQIENFEEYFGDVSQVKKLINDCRSCGAKLVQTHLSDYANLYIQENSKCTSCGKDNRKTIHILN